MSMWKLVVISVRLNSFPYAYPSASRVTGANFCDYRNQASERERATLLLFPRACFRSSKLFALASTPTLIEIIIFVLKSSWIID